MKHLLFLAFLIGTLSFSCAKKDDTSSKAIPNTIDINGSTYTTATIGTQTWTSLNYNGTGGVNYNNVSGNLASAGRLYSYAEANSIQLPTGWRLPSKDDVTKLLLYIGGSKDKYGDGTASGSIAGKLGLTQWPSAPNDNSTNFSAYPFGYYHSDALVFEGKDQAALFWTSSIVPSPNDAYRYGFGISNYPANGVTTLTAYLDFYKPLDKLSLRFVKDN